MGLCARIHSIETCGTVDGPGIRYVVFFQGCPLRCMYCHNPDTWDISSGKLITVKEIVSDVKRYKSYFKHSGGGFTGSGGEPLIQHEFLLELYKELKKQGIHTAIDTSGYGYVKLEKLRDLLSYTDLVLLDIKSINHDMFKKLTGVDIDKVLDFARYLDALGVPVWIRSVILPGFSDNKSHLEDLAKHLKSLNNIQKIELLPFHKMGEYKWEELGLDYKLKDTQPPNQGFMDEIKEIFRDYNLPILL